LHRAISRRELDRITEQVPDNLFDPRRVRMNEQTFSRCAETDFATWLGFVNDLLDFIQHSYQIQRPALQL